LNKDQPKNPRAASGGDAIRAHAADQEELLPGEIRRHKPPKEAVEAAFQRFQNLAADADAAVGEKPQPVADGEICPTCGHQNRSANRFCAMCGSTLAVRAEPVSSSTTDQADPEPSPNVPITQNPGARQHHHYHYHYFPGGTDVARHFMPGARDVDKAGVLPPTAPKGEHYSRAETAVRRLTQDWVIACNTKQLEDVLDLYGADAMVYRSNQPAVRAPAALREFFVAALDAGLGEVSMEAARVEVFGEMAYEAGKFTALLPGVGGKRREERGKYLRVIAKDAEGDWKISVDCWSSDLTLAAEEAVRPSPPPPRRA
jgi:ketosteroid isomerase-like protein